MDLAIWHNRSDGIKGGMNSTLTVVLKRKTPVSAGRIAPGNHEDGEALIDEEFHQGVLRRQIKDVIFHDPGRYDQNRLWPNLSRRRGVLDQLDEVVAKNNLARRDRDLLSNDEIFRIVDSAPDREAH